jgi:fatty acid desaturase
MITATLTSRSYIISAAAIVATVAFGWLFPVAAIGLYISLFLVLMGLHDYQRGAAVRRAARQLNASARSSLQLAA